MPGRCPDTISRCGEPMPPAASTTSTAGACGDAVAGAVAVLDSGASPVLDEEAVHHGVGDKVQVRSVQRGQQVCVCGGLPDPVDDREIRRSNADFADRH